MALITLPPITAVIDRVHPYIMGMPFMQFFLFIVPIALAAWLIIWFLLECKIEDRDAAKQDKEKGGGEE
jgi:hypothetical protein